jgi:hypothetical protein
LESRSRIIYVADDLVICPVVKRQGRSRGGRHTVLLYLRILALVWPVHS